MCNTDAVAIGTRLMHGTATQLSGWDLSRLTSPKTISPAWSKYHMDFPVTMDHTDCCFPPLLVLTLPGITMIPLFPKGGLVFSGTNPQSSITVAYNDLFRIFITSTEAVYMYVFSSCADLEPCLFVSCPKKGFF